jgi:hypothetical protein
MKVKVVLEFDVDPEEYDNNKSMPRGWRISQADIRREIEEIVSFGVQGLAGTAGWTQFALVAVNSKPPIRIEVDA